LVHLALLNYVYLYNVLCDSLDVIKFDIRVVVSYFFKNIHPLLILKCLVYYLGLSLINAIASDVL